MNWNVNSYVIALLPPHYDGGEMVKIVAKKYTERRYLVIDEDGVKCWIDEENILREASRSSFAE
jgi:hypothetical protein